MAKQSKRLKHYLETAIVFINTKDPRSDLQEIIIKNASEFVKLTYKAAKQGSVDVDIKFIDCEVTMSEIPEGMIAKLRLHVHHYSSVFFDLQPFLARLNTELSLKPGSVVKLEAEEIKREVKRQPSNLATVKHLIKNTPAAAEPACFFS